MTKNHRIPNLCSSLDCTGCSACCNICRKGAIRMEYNSEGYFNPIINSEKCIGCLQCEMVCPVQNPTAANLSEPTAFYGWSKDSDVRRNSSSGGAFSEIAKIVLLQGGAVWGAGFTDQMKLEYMCVDNISDLDKIRRSKYIQSKVGNCYQLIKEQLKAKFVLFCGTPCHVAGLYAYLRRRPANLLTIDFVCHGVPPQQLWESYVTWLENKYSDKLVDYNFREKKFGVNYNVATSATFCKIGKRYLYLKDNGYTLAFCQEKIIHQTCQACSFRSSKRHSDITISDYHMRERVCTRDQLYEGVSCIIVNSTQGNMMVQKSNNELHAINIRDVINGNPSYTRPSPTTSFCWNDTLNYAGFAARYIKLSLRDVIKTIGVRVFGTRICYKLFK